MCRHGVIKKISVDNYSVIPHRKKVTESDRKTGSPQLIVNVHNFLQRNVSQKHFSNGK